MSAVVAHRPGYDLVWSRPAGRDHRWWFVSTSRTLGPALAIRHPRRRDPQLIATKDFGPTATTPTGPRGRRAVADGWLAYGTARRSAATPSGSRCVGRGAAPDRRALRPVAWRYWDGIDVADRCRPGRGRDRRRRRRLSETLSVFPPRRPLVRPQQSSTATSGTSWSSGRRRARPARSRSPGRSPRSQPDPATGEVTYMPPRTRGSSAPGDDGSPYSRKCQHRLLSKIEADPTLTGPRCSRVPLPQTTSRTGSPLRVLAQPPLGSGPVRRHGSARLDPRRAAAAGPATGSHHAGASNTSTAGASVTTRMPASRDRRRDAELFDPGRR